MDIKIGSKIYGVKIFKPGLNIIITPKKPNNKEKIIEFVIFSFKIKKEKITKKKVRLRSK